jgi:hypothetical protein
MDTIICRVFAEAAKVDAKIATKTYALVAIRDMLSGTLIA